MPTVKAEDVSKLAGSEKLAFTIPQAILASGLSRSTLYALINDGSLRSTKVGRRRLIPSDALRALVGAV